LQGTELNSGNGVGVGNGLAVGPVGRGVKPGGWGALVGGAALGIGTWAPGGGRRSGGTPQPARAIRTRKVMPAGNLM
jgi:hypothetical protein